MENEKYPKYLFHEGTNYETYKLMCPKKVTVEGEENYLFHVYAPNATFVSLVGDFNDWNAEATPMTKDEGGIWEVAAPLKRYDNYKFCIICKDGQVKMKADPYALHAETAPGTASKVYDLDDFEWQDKPWMENRRKKNVYEMPVNIYELHMGSWKRYADGNCYDYKKLSQELIPYLKELNYTHVEIMPITEYPYEGSWGYQMTSLFAPTSRYGTPHDFMYFINECHKNGIGVILDWVVAHFPKDAHGLFEFDGSSLYEYEDPLKREHAEWGTMVFDYGKGEVKSFLISSAMFWCSVYHVDGLRVDAVASMLYLDYNRQGGAWRRNKFGGNYNLEAIEFLKALNKAVLTAHYGVMMIAEESTAFPMITKPTYDGGLGFNFKWNMGWMNDVLCYVSANPFFRKDMHNNLTFSITYAFSENYILPLSHDEVVHGKSSLIGKMPGSYEEKFEELKAFYGYMMAHPGKKLLFMGSEFGQFVEWNYQQELDWHLLGYERHCKLKEFVKDLNAYYLNNEEMYELDTKFEGFEWVCVDDNKQNIISFMRKSSKGDYTLAVINFSPVAREDYEMGVPEKKTYRAVLDSTLEKYGGENTQEAKYIAQKGEKHGQPYHIVMSIPANSVRFFKLSRSRRKI